MQQREFVGQSLTVDTCFPAVDVVLVLDRSGSMAGQPYLDAKLAVTNFLRNLHFTNNADKASLVSYNSSATLDQILTNSQINPGENWRRKISQPPMDTPRSARTPARNRAN